jgi:hypothetical protein
MGFDFQSEQGLSLRAAFGRLRIGFGWAQNKLREAILIYKRDCFVASGSSH